jgi:hypothetical protein
VLLVVLVLSPMPLVSPTEWRSNDEKYFTDNFGP